MKPKEKPYTLIDVPIETVISNRRLPSNHQLYLGARRARPGQSFTVEAETRALYKHTLKFVERYNARPRNIHKLASKKSGKTLTITKLP